MKVDMPSVEVERWCAVLTLVEQSFSACDRADYMNKNLNE